MSCQLSCRDQQQQGVMQYSSQAVVAVSVLQPEVVRHIELCFTKKGMKEMRPGRKKRAYPKRSEIIKIPADSSRQL